jgi:hypothetical protein
MITLQISKELRSIIDSQGSSILVKDNHGNYLGAELKIFFSKRPNNQLSVIDYTLPLNAGNFVKQLSILDFDKNSIAKFDQIEYDSRSLYDLSFN